MVAFLSVSSTSVDIGGVHLDLTEAFCKRMSLSVCPALDFAEDVKAAIDLKPETVSL